MTAPDVLTLRHEAPKQTCGVVWLNGLRSSMNGEKASALAHWCAAKRIDCTRFDYRGHGAAAARFTEFTISDWLNDAEAVFRDHAQAAQILIGSSMGGWLALLLAQRLKENPCKRGSIAGLILIAPAIDMTERLMWDRMSADVRAKLMRDGVFHRPSRYGNGDTLITRALIEDGRKHLFGDKAIDFHGPIHILHGVEDVDVPIQVSHDLCTNLARADVRLTLVPDGDHRLSRPQDIDMLFEAIGAMITQISASPAAQSAPSPSR